MEDLFAALIALVVGAMVLAIAIFVAVCVLVAVAAATTLWAFAAGAGSFGATFVSAVGARGGERRTPQDPEPAFELYVLGQLFADFRFAIERAAGVLAEVRTKLSAFADRWSEGATLPVSVGAVVGGYVGTILASLGGALVGMLVGLAVGLAFVVSWALIWVLRLADAVRRRIRRASYECPVDHERFSLPMYICPSCGAEHARLVPGRWGILKRECRCGKTALPTTVINGRQRVPQRCPSGHPMSGFLGFAENLPIAIVGGPSAGKSSFLAGALIELSDPSAGVSLEPLDESRDAYARLVDAMKAGVPPAKTVEERAPALVAEVQGEGRSRALYAYDMAGEVYGAEDKVRGLRFLARSAGIVMLLDPFSIARVADDRAQELAPLTRHILPSSEDPTRVFERLVATLRESGVGGTDIPLAVVITKVDACGIDAEIDKLAVTVGADLAPRAWLEANGAGNLVRAIDSEFKRVGWFSSSALGRMPLPDDTSPFVPRGALAPLLWVLDQRGVQVAGKGVVASHTAQRLVGTAADFPPPTSAERTRRALVLAVLASAAIVAPLAIAASRGTGSTHLAQAQGTHESSVPAANGAPARAGQSAKDGKKSRAGAIVGSKRRRTAHHARRGVRKKSRRHGHPGAAARHSSGRANTGVHNASERQKVSSSAGAPAGRGTHSSSPSGSGGLQGSETPAPSSGTGDRGGGGLHGSAQPESNPAPSGGGGLSGSAGN